MRRRGTSFNAKRSITKERRVGRNTYARKFRLRANENARSSTFHRMELSLSWKMGGWENHGRSSLDIDQDRNSRAINSNDHLARVMQCDNGGVYDRRIHDNEFRDRNIFHQIPNTIGFTKFI